MAVPAFVNAGAREYHSVSASTTAPLPTSRVNGNLLIAVSSWRVDANVILCDTPGWIKAYETKWLTGGSSIMTAVFYRPVDGTEAPPVFYRVSAAFTNTSQVFQFSGADLEGPFGAVAAGGAEIVGSLPSITTTKPDSLGLYIVGGRNYQAVLNTSVPSGYTEYSDLNVGNGIVIGGKAYPTSGTSTGALSFTTAQDVWAGFNMELYAPYDEGGKIKTYNGSAWVAKPVKYWNGVSWTQKPLKRWNGTAWVTTPY